MAKMLSAHNNIRTLKVRSAIDEVPQIEQERADRRRAAGAASGGEFSWGRWDTSTWPATRGT